jgi:hypothetical protein
MKWIELIRIRSSAATLQEAMPSLLREIREIQESASDVEVLLMQHALYDGDLAVFLVWKDGGKPQRTRRGFLLAKRLQELGTIEHAVWMPAEEMGN